MSTRNFNRFLFLKLPSAFLCGVRLRSLNKERAVVTVTLNFLNKNPFKSMFWAVQGMAAELATGVIILSEVKSSNVPISMLVTRNEAEFLKKAKGKITFTCTDVTLVKNQFATYLQSETGTRFWMQSEGVDEQGEVVSRFRFEWSVKAKD
jgi:acyl-coenzyme A thioesterase PaaI-like protein